MTPAEVKTFINEEITTNGNNEITAAVLCPVLFAIIDQINNLVGSSGDLPDGATNVIQAINSLDVTGVQVYTGTENPNDTPPSSFNVGDFYSQTLSSVIIAFWQNNGIQWVEILSRAEQKLRNIAYTVGNYDILSSDDVIICNAELGGFTITLPSPVFLDGKIITIVNISSFEQVMSSYNTVNNTTTTIISENEVLKVISRGLFWQQINNSNELLIGS